MLQVRQLGSMHASWQVVWSVLRRYPGLQTRQAVVVAEILQLLMEA
mgnify:CR=1 FL=1